MYVDKPMRAHGLMQAIARVNRVFGDKPGGLVVDYLGLAHELKRALATYTESGGTGAHGCRHRTRRYRADGGEVRGLPRSAPRLRLVGMDIGDGNGAAVTTAGRAGAHPRAGERQGPLPGQPCARSRRRSRLAVPHEETHRIRDDVGFFQAVRAALAKRAEAEARPAEDLDLAVRQIISRAVASEGVMDIFAAAGLEKPDISVLSDEFLAEVREACRHRNLAVELLQKLLKGELATRRRKNVVQARSFAELLEQTLRRYQNRAIEAAQVIEELIELAKGMRQATERGEQLGLSDDELAFYDALETPTTALSRSWVTRPCGTSPASWSRRSGATSPSTGPCGRTFAPS